MSDRASDESSIVEEGLLKPQRLAGQAGLVGYTPAPLAQTQAEEKLVVAQVRNVNETGTAITLVDGTRLLTPPGWTVRRGVLTHGTLVIASYREEEDGNQVLTKLFLGQSEPIPGETPTQQ